MAHLHAIDGFLPFVQVFGLFIPTYYPVVSIAFCICLLWLLGRAKARGFELRDVIDSAILVMCASFLGARLLHVVFEDFDFYSAHPVDILKFWNGGFVFYGGAFMAFFCGIIFLRVRRLPVGKWLDLYAPVAALGYTLGRMACFMTGCCFGEACEWIPKFEFRHPTQLYAVILESLILVILLRIEKPGNQMKQKFERPEAFIFCVWLVLHSGARIFMEAFRADPRGPELVGLSLSSWLSIAILFMTLLYLMKPFEGRSKRFV